MAYRIAYTICFLALCMIDWIIGSQDGRIQFVAINSIGLIVAGIILSSGNHKFKDFLKPVYAVWAAVSLIGGSIAVWWGVNHYPYKGRWISGVILVIVYGFLLIRIGIRTVKERKSLKFKPVLLAIWALMIVFMMIAKNEAIWPLYYGVMFGCLYMTDFPKERMNALIGGLVDGIILGFFVIEGLALLFRPFDMPRYYGMYANPNITALFFMISFVAFLAKWLLMIKKRTHIVFRLLIAFLASAMYGFVLMTGCKTAFFGMFLATVLFLIALVRLKGKKIHYFFAGGALIVLMAIASVPVTYYAARYMPTIHLHPIYFLAEYSESKVLPGEPRDSEKYTSMEEMLEENMGRFLFFIYRKDETYELPQSVTEPAEEKVMTPEEEAELNARIEEALIKPGESAGPFKIRFLVHSNYLKRLNIVGHSYSEDGVPIFFDYHPEHAHNFLLQMAFWFGIHVGLMLIAFIVMAFISSVRLWKQGRTIESFVVSAFLLAILAYGVFEIMWRCGQMSFTLFFVLLYPLFQKMTKKEESIEKNDGQ